MVVVTCLIPGKERNEPNTGTLFKNINTVGKKALNSAMNPYPSTNNPKNGHPYNTNNNPKMKQNAPR